MTRLVVASNRISAPSERDSRAGGLAVALREALRRHGGIWFGWSGRIAEQPSPEPEILNAGPITFATIDLSPQEHETYYAGYANGSLWPLLHYRLGLMEFRRRQFEGYLAANARFAAILARFIRPGDLVWIHDYHLIPLGEALRRLGVSNRIGFFLHTPFPASEAMTALPGHDRLMACFAAYDLIGFQTEIDLRCFRDYVVREAGGDVRNGLFSMHGGSGRAAAFPIGIDTERFVALAERSAHSPETLRLKESLADRQLITGVDRLDYSKGLLERFEALATLLDRYPQHRSRLTFLQIAPPSRADLLHYQTIRRDLERAAGRINGRFAEFDWAPIRYLNRSFPRSTLAGFFRLSRVGLVTPLRDGMNLVAKEYVAAQDPEDPGVLVLSCFAGAAQELTSALLVNPLDRDAVADALHRALEMPLAERRARWQALCEVVRANTVTTWHDRFLAALAAPGRRVLRDARPVA